MPKSATIACDAYRFIDSELCFAIELGAQGFAVDERHHIKQKSVGRPAVEQRQDVRMLQRRSGLDLLHKPLGAEYGREFRLEQLERDLAIVFEIVAQVHRGHAAFAEMAENTIAAVERGVEAVGLCGHELMVRMKARQRSTVPHERCVRQRSAR